MEEWTGIERRKQGIVYCDKHIELATGIARIEASIAALDKRINGSFEVFTKHVDNEGKWRLGTVMTGVTIIVTLVINVIFFAAMWGSSNNQIHVNTARLDKLEALHYTVK